MPDFRQQPMQKAGNFQTTELAAIYHLVTIPGGARCCSRLLT